MGHTPVHDDGAAHAPVDRVDAALHLGDHAPGDNLLVKQRHGLVNGEARDQRGRVVFIPQDADPGEAIYSPLYGDFKGFPPVLVQVGQNEVLLDDSRSLAYRIENAGGSVTLDVEKEGWHVYQQMPIALATRAMKRLSAFVTDTIYR